MKWLAGRIERYGRRVSLVVLVVVLLVVFPFIFLGEVRAARVRRELNVDRAFLEKARVLGRELHEPLPPGLRCDAPLVSRNEGKAFFGVTEAVALLVAPVGRRLPWPGGPEEMIVSSAGCARSLAFVDAMEQYATLSRQLHELRLSWRQPSRALEVGPLPVCMGSQLTDFGLVLVPRLSEDGRPTGRADVRVFDFPDGPVRCEGSVELPTVPEEDPGRTSERAFERAYGALVERLVASARPRPPPR